LSEKFNQNKPVSKEISNSKALEFIETHNKEVSTRKEEEQSYHFGIYLFNIDYIDNQ